MTYLPRPSRDTLLYEFDEVSLYVGKINRKLRQDPTLPLEVITPYMDALKDRLMRLWCAIGTIEREEDPDEDSPF